MINKIIEVICTPGSKESLEIGHYKQGCDPITSRIMKRIEEEHVLESNGVISTVMK